MQLQCLIRNRILVMPRAKDPLPRRSASLLVTWWLDRFPETVGTTDAV